MGDQAACKQVLPHTHVRVFCSSRLRISFSLMVRPSSPYRQEEKKNGLTKKQWVTPGTPFITSYSLDNLPTFPLPQFLFL